MNTIEINEKLTLFNDCANALVKRIGPFSLLAQKVQRIPKGFNAFQIQKDPKHAKEIKRVQLFQSNLPI